METRKVLCKHRDNCKIIELEREKAVENLRAHLSEQRHDFFNMLQVIYGLTQLKKTEKVLEYIRNYSRKLESIGRIYNSKCIKLADLLYTKEKEAGNIEVNFEVIPEICYNLEIRVLDDDRIIHTLESVINTYFYLLNVNDRKDATVVVELRESADSYTLEVYCKELRDNEMEVFPYILSEKEVHWNKISGNVKGLDSIIELCKAEELDAKLLDKDLSFILKVDKEQVL